MRLLPEEGYFVINSEQKTHVVSLYPKESCTCNCKRHCQHIKAAKLSIGDNTSKHKNIKLSNVIRKRIGYKSGRKATPKNITVVEAAKNSQITKEDNNTLGVLVPTITTSKKSVKYRAVCAFSKV